MHVPQDKGERVLAAVVRPGLADGAGWRVRPERLVVSAPVVIAGESETTRRPEDNEGGRPGQPRRPPPRLRAEPAPRRFAEDLGGVERRQIRPEVVVRALKRGPRGVGDERAEHEQQHQRVPPPTPPPAPPPAALPA